MYLSRFVHSRFIQTKTVSLSRQLNDKLQSKTREWESKRELLEREPKHELLERKRAAAASGAPSAYFKEHVTRHCSENLDLQEKLDQQLAKSFPLAQQVSDPKKRLQEARGTSARSSI